MAARWAKKAQELPEDHPGWDLEAEYLAHLAATLTLVLSPRRILFGGGVMRQTFVFPRLRRRFAALLGGCLCSSLLLPRARRRGFGFALCRAGRPLRANATNPAGRAPRRHTDSAAD